MEFHWNSKVQIGKLIVSESGVLGLLHKPNNFESLAECFAFNYFLQQAKNKTVWLMRNESYLKYARPIVHQQQQQICAKPHHR